jgi:superfamily I DNA and/or RNA helicase
MSSPIQQALLETARLLEIERQEDLRQYQQFILQTPLHVRKQKGLSWAPVKLLASEIGMGEKFYITLERKSFLDEPHAFQVGGMVTVYHHGQGKDSQKAKTTGVISSVWKNVMKVALHEDELPDWLDEYTTLGVDVLFDALTYKEMDLALQKVIAAKEGRLAQLKEILLGHMPPVFEDQYPGFHTGGLNPSQEAAIAKICNAQDVAIVHGPPGTGKTTTLVHAVKAVLAYEKQVLVTAPSNTAVDLLTERLAGLGIKVVRIGNPARVSEELSHHSLEAQLAMHPDYKYLKKLQRSAEEFKKMAHKYKRKFGKAEQEQRRLLFQEARKALDEANYLEKYLVDQILDGAGAITATLVGSMYKHIRFKHFSTVFIDEAGQALEPACWIPITKAQRVVFAGDHQQLPPTIKSYEAAQQGLQNTLFEKAVLRTGAAVMLDVQYRMHEQIMQFSNQEFYQGALQAASNVARHSLSPHPEDVVLGQPVEFIDTAGCSFDEQENPETKSKCNHGEAGLLVTHLTNLYEYAGLTHKALLEEGFSVGIISPYQAQVDLLKEKIQESDALSIWKHWLQISSIDGFQGQEKDVIYLSLVRSNDKGKIGFLSDTRRFNVAITRARKKLVIIGDSSTLSQHPFFQSFLAYIDQIGAYKSAWEWMG